MYQAAAECVEQSDMDRDDGDQGPESSELL